MSERTHEGAVLRTRVNCNPIAWSQSVFKAFGKSKIFVERPVDPIESGCPDYFTWIKPEEARDLGTIRAQLKSRTHFPTPRAFADVRNQHAANYAYNSLSARACMWVVTEDNANSLGSAV